MRQRPSGNAIRAPGPNGRRLAMVLFDGEDRGFIEVASGSVKVVEGSLYEKVLGIGR
jgi:hypothetical protein